MTIVWAFQRTAGKTIVLDWHLQLRLDITMRQSKKLIVAQVEYGEITTLLALPLFYESFIFCEPAGL